MNLIRLLIFIPVALFIGDVPSEFFIRYIDDGVFYIPTNDEFDDFILWVLTFIRWWLTFYIAARLKPTFFKKKFFKFIIWICFGGYLALILASMLTEDIAIRTLKLLIMPPFAAIIFMDYALNTSMLGLDED